MKTTALALPLGAEWSEHAALGPVLVLRVGGATAEVALHGATVLSYRPAGAERDLLWVSSKAAAAEGKAIRGGVPLCGPWFGPHATVAGAPMHGLMRTRAWALTRVEPVTVVAGGGLRAEFALALPAEKEKGWTHAAQATFAVTLGATLAVELTVRNTGDTPFMLSEALHTYFAVSDVRGARVDGLAERDYVDYTAGGVRRRSGLGPVALTTEAANFYLGAGAVRLVDEAWGRVITVRASGAGATVVWNPWDKTAATMGDVGEEWPRFICVENANIPQVAVPLAPAMSHHLGAEFALEAV